jgi:hypothetical protein
VHRTLRRLWSEDRDTSHTGVLLGRPITKEEAREFTHIVRRIAALLLLEPELDKNYPAVKAQFYARKKPIEA